MVAVAFDAENGTNGTTLTAGNTGFDAVAGGTPPPTFATAAAAHGSLGYRLFQSGTSQNVRIDTFQSAASRIRCAFAIKASSGNPSGALQVSYWTNSTNASLLPRIIIDSTRHLGIQNAGNTTLFTGATALANDVWYRVELVWEPGASTSTGKLGFGYALLEDPINSGGSDYYWSTTANMGTTGVGRWTLPKISGSWTTTTDLDDIRADDTTFTSNPTTWLGSTSQDLTGTLTVTGSGTTTFGAASVTAAGTLARTGAGTLTLTPTLIGGQGGTLTRTGAGTLSISGSPAFAGALSPTGSGTLTLSGLPGAFGTLARTGSGLLDLTGIGFGTFTATGSGTLTLGTVTFGATGTLAQTGSGLLALGIAAMTTAGTLARTGSGALALSGLLGAFGTLTRTGSGTLTMTGFKLIVAPWTVWTGADWVQIYPKVWDGSTWLDVPVRPLVS